jgi:hypothetical protein
MLPHAGGDQRVFDFSATEKRTVIAALDARRSNFGAAIEARLEDRAER